MFSLLSYLLAVFIHSSRSNPCPYIRSSIVLNECHFNTKIYAQLGVSVTHSKSIYFSASYSLERSNETLFISNFHDRWLLPFPFLLSCSNHSIIPSHLAFTECQSTIHHPSQEYMTTSLSSIELPHHGLQPILYLSQGEMFFRSCKIYDCLNQRVYLTAPNEIFHIQIDYENFLGDRCESNVNCHHAQPDLLHCHPQSKTCQCTEETVATVLLSSLGSICVDSIDYSNCTKHPQRCLPSCHTHPTVSLCLCPKSTRKVRRINGSFDCELDSLSPCDLQQHQGLKCPTGTYCDGSRCQPRTITLPINISSSMPSSTQKTKSLDQPSPLFLPSLAIIVSTIIFLFLFILCLLTILIQSSSRHQSSSSSNVQSTMTTTTTFLDLSTDHFNSDLYRSDQRLPGLIASKHLSSRFRSHRPQHEFNRRSVPIYRQSFPSSIHQNKSLSPLPTILFSEDGIFV